MIGSIDMFASISSMPVTSIAITGRLSGTVAQPPCALCPALRGGRCSSLIRNVVARNVTKMIAPAAKNVARIPISCGSAPPISGPARLPAMMPDDSTPSAQAVRALGVCVATSVIEPEE